MKFRRRFKSRDPPKHDCRIELGLFAFRLSFLLDKDHFLAVIYELEKEKEEV